MHASGLSRRQYYLQMQQQFDNAARQAWMSLLSRAPLDALEQWAARGVPAHTWLRKPETGLVMVRGRAGASGARFNLGEMTLTRCALRLVSGEAGVAYVQGRSTRHAELAALADGMLQAPASAAAVQRELFDSLREQFDQRRHRQQSHAQATRVEFFTLVRGEN